MDEENLYDEKIISSWARNVEPWVKAVRNNEIESRRLVTNKAIVDVVLSNTPEKVIDVGCGEGWLTRELTKSGLDCLGVDIIPELIEHARKEDRGRFQVVSYDDLSYDTLGERFDAIVCNFSLLGKESVETVFQHASTLLNEGGSLIVQTLHPKFSCGEAAYEDGWREGSWTGFSSDFCDPAPWYFRTMESWVRLFSENDFTLSEKIEPINPATQQPASIIFSAKRAIIDQ